MKKILLMIIIVLLIIFTGITIIKGTTIFKFHINSMGQIKEISNQLDKNTEELNNLIDVTYPQKMTELKQAYNKMLDTKKQYLDETNMSSDEEIQSALQVESYDIERLWARVGNHAKKTGTSIKLVLARGSMDSNETKNLNFTVNGDYIAITNFLYALEDDEELNFRIYEFKLLPVGSGETLEATFVVKDVRITTDSLNENLGGSSQTTQSSSSNDSTEDKDVKDETNTSEVE